MQKNLDNNDFERFVRQNADQYRMYPSEKVWKGIYSSLHVRKKWYILGISFVILASVVATWTIINSPKAKLQTINNLDISPTKNNQRTIEKQSEINSIKNTFPDHINKTSFSPGIKKKAAKNRIASIPKGNVVPDINQTSVSLPAIHNNEPDNVNLTEKLIFAKKDEAHILPTPDLIYRDPVNNDKPAGHPEKFITGINQTAVPEKSNDFSPESSENSKALQVKHRKIKWQISVAPTISYRRLTENKSYLQDAAYASSNYSYAYFYNVNSVVTHKPDMGFEIGLIAGYPLTKKLKVRAGMQFNINRYGIKAYSYTNEVATIALNSNRGKDSLNEVTQYRNFNGYKSGWLQNFYFSASAPVGIEYNFTENNKTNFGIAGTIQPTYIISDRAYLISTDYKNYVEVPWLVRRWNMNTGLELFVTYSTAKMNWQLGPQVRYQLLSSFRNQYPVKENLFDFGFKVGISLNK
ncbi:MAG: hypothetical protein B6D37_04630 [Sphingobacteriales bacterium UTBCD1]|jgi:hypothetical protein|nr:MAG: hypothetical protein B6D37_04630 [Sphingobacteriales bacterium UTBCD1]